MAQLPAVCPALPVIPLLLLYALTVLRDSELCGMRGTPCFVRHRSHQCGFSSCASPVQVLVSFQTMLTPSPPEPANVRWPKLTPPLILLCSSPVCADPGLSPPQAVFTEIIFLYHTGLLVSQGELLKISERVFSHKR